MSEAQSAIFGKGILVLAPSVLGSLLSYCSKLCVYSIGRSIHAAILKHEDLHLNAFLQNHLVNFYAKCRNLASAQRLFDKILVKNTVTWTALISGYDQCGRSAKSLELFSLMSSQDPCSCPNEYTYTSVISACSNPNFLVHGQQVHSHVLKRGLLAHVMVSNALLSFYMSHAWVPQAELVFAEIHKPDEISWNALLSGLAKNGYSRNTVQTFRRMRSLDIRLTSFALSSCLSACSDSEKEVTGKTIHGVAVKTGLDVDCFTGSALIRMYSQSRMMNYGFKVFEMLEHKDVASWNALIEGYGENSQGEEGLRIFCNFMKCGLKVDEITITTVMGISTRLVMLEFGNQVHSLTVKTSLNCRMRVRNSMIDMYGKCGNVGDGIKIFQEMENKSVVSWTTMMWGLSYHGRVNEVLQSFEEMKMEGVAPNNVTYTCSLYACAQRGLVEHGKRLFKSMEIDPVLDHYICMVHLLAGNGRFEEAEEFIKGSPKDYSQCLWETYLINCKNSDETCRGLETARAIMADGLPMASPMLVLLSQVFAAAGRWDEVETLRGEIKQRGMKKEPGCSWVDVGSEVHVFGMEKQVSGLNSLCN